MYVVIWEFRVRQGQARAFERAYGPDGAWARLFLQGEGYLRTELLRDARDERRYLTLDRWRSAEAYERFRAEQRETYAALDQRCEALTEHETFLGAFLSLPTD
jgi:heme-degrading monooxygenase HmoA